ncbi:hypothetical protein F8S09_01810 [Deinococcus sp. SDU3-2]|uniref:Uncharacterized protein n=1 Tax=Deinococcus terrestris TaxID=2651870 RepID=A0A7X1NU77_9DEIO|nr:hypothetical protein [Deinococcus terrestris]MPY65429.1 hypothetical protein [Deinococcus terrestris]
MTDNRYGDAPLGRSVEEIEQESGNLVNSSLPGETVRDNDTAAVPAIVNSNQSASPAVVNPENMMVSGGGADDGTAHTHRDGGEETS